MTSPAPPSPPPGPPVPSPVPSASSSPSQPNPDDGQRSIGLLGATGVGVGAIVGGGIMVLAGVAFENAGPAAVIAFALNGAIAFMTAMSFAEMSSRFPLSGGAYTFATKVLSVQAAFGVGWIVWFAYIVAGVLYALGFAAFAIEGARHLIADLGGVAPEWLATRRTLVGLAMGAMAVYAVSLIRKNAGGGQYATVGKVVVFAVLILVGVVAVMRQPLGQTGDALAPFFTGGVSGVVFAMGLTFIALQGFDLVAAIAGEVQAPERNIPRAMFLSLGCALVIYLPLIVLLTVLGVEPGDSIAAMARREGDTVFAVAVSRYMGDVGYWLVIAAAVLSTLSALHANILAASRVALAMARGRTLPAVLGDVHEVRRTPVMAIYATALAMVAILFMIPDVGTAGAAAGLIFLLSFALAHWTSYLARIRGEDRPDLYQTPWFPVVPVVGGGACAALAVFQAVMVPSAGGIVAIWLALGAMLYMALLRNQAETADASAEAFDPSLAQLRGKRPLVLLPVANPAHARALIGVANAIAPTRYARVLLLTVVKVPGERDEGGAASLEGLQSAQKVVNEALTASYSRGEAPEALITTAADPWQEIERVAAEHDCESLLLGLRDVPHESTVLETEVEGLINRVDCDVAIMRAPHEWALDDAERILVPVGGRGQVHGLRARVIGSLCRTKPREVTFVTVIPAGASAGAEADRRRQVKGLAEVKLPGARVEVLRSDDAAAALIEASGDHDLVVVGLQSVGWRSKVLGGVSLRIAREAACATIMLSGARSRAFAELYRPLREAVGRTPGKRR